jgi:hypothetical protein
MISKTMIGVILASAMVASAMVYDGIAHRHHENASTANPPMEQKPAIPKPQAGTPLNATLNADQADTANDPNAPAQQQNDASADPNQNQLPDDQSDAGDSDQGPEPVAAARRQTAMYTAAAVRLRPIARVRVVHVVRPVVAATAVYVDRPVALVASVVPVSLSAITVPTGTPLTLRLAEPLGSRISQADQSFSATLDRDIDLNGKTVIAAGAPVTGKVVFARPAGPLAGEANLQIEVTSINFKNQDFDVLTAARSFGPAIQGKTKISRFMKGLAKRAEGQEHEVLLQEQTAFTFTLSRPLKIQ